MLGWVLGVALVIISHYLLRIFRGEVSKKVKILTSMASKDRCGRAT